MTRQSVPVNWKISSPRKRDFFDLLARITGSPGTPPVTLEWSRAFGHLTVRVGREPAVRVERVEVLVNDEVAASTTQAPFELRMDGLPERAHWVRARVVYHNGQREVRVESPYYRNPWSPYGGPARP